jgi:hypothetical protein
LTKGIWVTKGLPARIRQIKAKNILGPIFFASVS